MTDHASSTHKPAKGDERNVVAVDPAAPQATLEERLTAIWAQNRTVILVGIVLVIAAIIGRSIWDARVAAQQRETQAAYGRAETIEAKLAFAREHDGHPLAGVAVLTAADEAYTQADYTAAQKYYAQAMPMLTEPTLAARARLGEALSTLQSGAASKAEESLRKIGDDTTAPEAIRAEAWYHLAAHFQDSGNVSAARDALNKVQQISPRGLWTMRAGALAAKLPAETPEGTMTP